jgi:hypothetical protein
MELAAVVLAGPASARSRSLDTMLSPENAAAQLDSLTHPGPLSTTTHGEAGSGARPSAQFLLRAGKNVQDAATRHRHADRVTEIACYVHGSFPRSEELVAATRDADRGRRPASAVAAQRDLDRAGFLALQEEAGLDYRSAGWMSWADLFGR